MKRVYSDESLANVGHVKTLLEQQGIGCFLKNEQLSGALGELPFLECLPEVWVYSDAESDQAEAIIQDLMAAPLDKAESWRCRNCGETNEGQYAACWNCGTGDAPE
jgi:hypothetical protein